ncbi:MAG: tetratricopeptide repeat protein [Desulfuromonadales bacterium]|nr:tetratricopeptide repeat protein [Desulfuromonadales bacterium]
MSSSEDKPAGKDSAEYHYTLGVSYLKESQTTEALKEFLEAEKFDDKDPEIQVVLAQAYWLKRAHPQAEKHLLRAIKLSDNDPNYINNLAALYLSMERYDEAITTFRIAADNILFDRPEMAWTGIGRAYAQMNNFPAAQNAYKKALSLNSQYYEASFHLGELLFNLNRPVEALDAFTKAVTLAPRMVVAHYWQGLAYMRLQQEEKAREAFEEVIRLSPTSEEARLSRDYLKML